MNRQRLAVVMEDRIHLYEMSTMKILKTVETCSNDTGDNPTLPPVFALSPSPGSPLLAYPTIGEAGEIGLLDTETLQVVGLVHAHKSPVSLCVFNQEGSMLATASDKVIIVLHNYFPF